MLFSYKTKKSLSNRFLLNIFKYFDLGTGLDAASLFLWLEQMLKKRSIKYGTFQIEIEIFGMDTFQKCEMNQLRHRFSTEEDERLNNLVKELGAKKWKAIAQRMPGRTAKQCRDRYCDYLNPSYLNSEWTQDEDQLLIEKYNIFGSQWSKMTQFFKGRNGNSLKNRWNYFICRNYPILTNQSRESRVKTENVFKDFRPVQYEAPKTQFIEQFRADQVFSDFINRLTPRYEVTPEDYRTIDLEYLGL